MEKIGEARSATGGSSALVYATADEPAMHLNFDLRGQESSSPTPPANAIVPDPIAAEVQLSY